MFSNPGIRNRLGEMLGGGNIFSNHRYGTIREGIEDICLGVFCLENGIRDKGEVENILDTVITNVEYGKLRDCIKYVRGKFKPVWDMRGRGKSIEEWLEPIKKGSGRLRCIMSGRGAREYRNFNLRR